MIIKQTPVVRRDWPAGTTGTDKSEGKFAKLSADGQTMSLVTSATPSLTASSATPTDATAPTATAAT